ncbi:MAG: methanogenesis marker 16 metalloprotein [Methanobacteriaceae archaeon]|nr:methanogenesis marker 16 metalloprotein [Methanobacteriaceae archaeon]
MKTIHDIEEKIENKTANILTAQELKEQFRNNNEITVEDVDIVTTGTCGVMSGTTAILHLPVDKPGSFQKAKKVYLNGIESYPGPCPNEYLGSVDLIVYGTNHSQTIPDYGGGFLFKDLIDNKKIDVTVIDINDNKIKTSISLDEIPFAKLMGTRMAFKNYTAFTNPTAETVKSIFNAKPMNGEYSELSFSGCGDINPLQNDPEMNIITENTKALLNGASATVISTGTRSTSQKPNLMIIGDMKNMNSKYIGGFKTGLGPEVYNTVSIPIPVLNEDILSNLKVLNNDIDLPLADIHGRHLPLSTINYGLMWDNVNYRPSQDLNKCLNCDSCSAENSCPTNAYHKNKTIDMNLCYGCGMCKTSCPHNVVNMNLGKIVFNNQEISVTCRQSDKLKAINLTHDLKNQLLNGDFKL